jgi:hypothetical protein
MFTYLSHACAGDIITAVRERKKGRAATGLRGARGKRAGSEKSWMENRVGNSSAARIEFFLQFDLFLRILHIDPWRKQSQK